MIGAARRGRPAQYQRELARATEAANLRDVTFAFDCHDEDDLWSAELGECEAVVLTSRGLGAAALAGAPRLRFVQKLGIAAERVCLDACRARGIAVSVLSDAGHVAVAEHTILLMLALGRHLVEDHLAASAGENPRGLEPIRTSQDRRHVNWLGRPDDAFSLLAGTSVGLIGMGEIGREVARRLRAFGACVRYHTRRRLPEALERELGVTHAGLDELLTESRIVSLHATQPDGAPPILGAGALALMRRDAVLVNTARGNQVDEPTLVAMLRNGLLRGAALDVFETEPVARETFAGLDNVVLTPHTAGIVPLGLRFEAALRNVAAFAGDGTVEGRIG